MDNENYCILPSALLPLSSDEPIAEWDVVSDSIFFSQGAQKLLNLTDPPRKMEAFYKLLPPEGIEELRAARAGIVSGKIGSQLASSYLCNGLWVRERMITLSRNSAGQATRIMGTFEARSLLKSDLGFHLDTGHLADVGLWICQPKRGLIWRDGACSEILGLPKTGPTVVRMEEALKDIHPADRDRLHKHYEIFGNGKTLGDQITDIARFKDSDGHYAPMILRAWAVERNKDGQVIVMAGALAASSPDAPGLDSSLVTALNNLGVGQWNWDTSSQVLHLCDRFMDMLGYSPKDAEKLGAAWRDYVHPDDLAKVETARSNAIASRDNGDVYECTYRMKRADGGWAWLFDRGCVAWRDASGHGSHMIGSITNITTAQAERDRLEELVRHDTLTGLRSRAFCNLEMEHIEQNQIRPVTVISMDISGLKMVNDSLGHGRGDELLTKAAALLHGALRQTDCIARVGGDEFLALLPGCDLKMGQKILTKIKDAFHNYNENAMGLPVFGAFGLACAETMKISLQETIALADKNMYENKKKERKNTHSRLEAWIRSITGKNPVPDDRIS